MVKKVVKLSATWCNPCKYYKEIFDKVTKKTEFSDIEFIQYDVENDDEGVKMCNTHQIFNIPTTILFDENNDVINKLIGVVSENELIATIQKNL